MEDGVVAVEVNWSSAMASAIDEGSEHRIEMGT